METAKRDRVEAERLLSEFAGVLSDESADKLEKDVERFREANSSVQHSRMIKITEEMN